MAYSIGSPCEKYRPYEIWGSILDGLPADRDDYSASPDPREECQWEQAYTFPVHDHNIPRFP